MRSPARRRAPALAFPALLLASVLALAGCGGDDKKDAFEGKSPTEVLALGQQALDDTTGVSISLSTKNLPGGVTGITKATGVGIHPAAFEGSFDLSVSGLPATADVIAVDGATYARNSLLLPDWTEIDPAKYGAPDPIELMTPGKGFSALIAATTGVKQGDSVRGGSDNKDILTEFSGTVPGKAVASLIPTATGDFDVTYTIADDGEIRQADVTGVFYEGSDALTYVIGLEDYGTKKDITAP